MEEDSFTSRRVWIPFEFCADYLVHIRTATSDIEVSGKSSVPLLHQMTLIMVGVF